MNNHNPLSFDKTTLVWLSLSYWLMILPLYQELSSYIYAGSLFVIGLRFAIKLGHFKEPHRFFAAALAIIGAGIIAVFGSQIGLLNAMLNVLVLGCALKFLEFNSKRNLGFHILALFFLGGVSFVYHQDIGISLYLLFVCLLNITALLSVYYNSSFRLQAQRSAQLVLQSIPLMIVLFVIIPRLGPLWAMPQLKSAQTGMSDSMSPGDFTDLARSSDLVFRASFNDEKPKDNYWRALVFEAFDGRTWRVAKSLSQWMEGVRLDRPEVYTFKPIGKGLEYNIILEPSNSHWFYTLNYSSPSSTKLKVTPYSSLYSRLPISKKQQYSLKYYAQGHQVESLSKSSRKQNLSLPSEGNKQAKNMARQLRKQYSNDQALAEATMEFFNQEPFYYTLKPPLLGTDSIDQFLFSTRKGFCEHYASSFTFLMREAGIPARVVVGYLGGEYNEANNYLSIYQFDAHAWVELWFDDSGWTRFDPTSMVAPQRVNQGLDQIFQDQGFTAQDPFSLVRYRNTYFINKLRLMMADIDYKWSVWVLGFDSNKQKKLLSDWLGQGVLSQLLGLFLAIALVILCSWFIGRLMRGGFKRDPLLEVYLSSCQLMAKHGFKRQAGETPLQYSHRITLSNNPIAPIFSLITYYFIQGRYAEEPQQEKLSIKKIKHLKSKLKNS